MYSTGTGRALWASALVLVLLLAVAPISGFAADEGESMIPGNRIQRAAESLRSLQVSYPGVRVARTGHLVERVYGRSFSEGATAEESADRFINEYAAVLGTAPTELIPERDENGKRIAQPVMYNAETDSYKFTLYRYTQNYGGLDVYGAELRLLVRNEPSHPLVLAVSSLRDVGGSEVDTKASLGSATTAEQVARAAVPTLDEFSDARTVIWSGVNDEMATPAVATEIVGSSDFPERYRFIVDASTGEVLHQKSLILFEDAVGSVSGMATQGPASEQCEDEVTEVMPWATVIVDGFPHTTDRFGSFSVPVTGTEVIVRSGCEGQWFDIYNFVGDEVELVDTITLPETADFLHNGANTNEHIRAQVNAYVQANVIHDYVTSINPSYPTLDNEDFPITVNRNDGYCPGNAWYDQIEISMNFCSASGSYPNTAWSSVLHHEYGHHLVEMAGSGQDQYGEGIGDCMSVLLSDSPYLGLGFYGDCGTPLRNADNTFQYPCNGEAHDCAGLMSGCVWDIREELAITYPSTYLDILGPLVVNSILLHTGSLTTPQIAIDFLTLDDDDANLDNGTPHYPEICTGFSLHNMDCPELNELAFVYPNGRPESVLPGVTTTVRVEVEQAGMTPDPGTLALYTSVNGSPFTAGTVTVAGVNQYDVELPVVDCGDNLEWYVTVQADGLTTISDPKNAPTDNFAPVVATDDTTPFADDFGTNQGWSVSGSVGDGPWGRGVPAGGGDRGDPSIDYDGNDYCYLTDNVDGNSDVDDGTTILTSPAFNALGGTAIISYARWFSNNQGDSPYEDVFRVLISNDNGSNWTQVDSAGPETDAVGGWVAHSVVVNDFLTPTATMRIRFEASDLGSGSIVEAAVDAVEVRVLDCQSSALAITTSAIPSWTEGLEFSPMQLEANNGSGSLTWTDLNGDLAGSGLTLSSSGILSGMPTSAGDITFTAHVEDESMNTDDKVFFFTINEALAITTSSLPERTVTTVFPSTQLAHTGGTGDGTWTDRDGVLAAYGLALSASGMLSGTTTADGTVPFVARVTDEVGSYTDQALDIVINPELVVTEMTLPDAFEDIAYSVELEFTGGTPGLTWMDISSSLDPYNLAVQSNGFVTGTPTGSGTVQFMVMATDASGASDSQGYTLVINPSFICGDVTGDGIVDIGDLTSIIQYLFIDFEEVNVPAAGDLDDAHDGKIDIGDLTKLIAYLFTDGDDLVCE